MINDKNKLVVAPLLAAIMTVASFGVQAAGRAGSWGAGSWGVCSGGRGLDLHAIRLTVCLAACLATRLGGCCRVDPSHIAALRRALFPERAG